METREIRSSRLKYAGYLAFGLVFVGIAAWLLNDAAQADRRAWVWFGLVFFSAGTLAFVWMLIRPQRLRLDREGFTLSGGFVRSPKKVPWTDVSEFFAYELPRGGTMVGYNFLAGARPDSALLGLNRRFGAEAALPRGWPMSPEKLADELEAYRVQALTIQD